MKKNILVVDIGNTSTQFGIFEGKRLKKTFRIPTSSLRGPKGRSNLSLSQRLLRRPFGSPRNDGGISVAGIASVVPSAGTALKKFLRKNLNVPVYLLGRDIPIPIKNLYKNPRQVGADRLVNALAAYEKYRRAAIVIDFGTAITFDVVSKKGEYLGGAIAPGIEISIQALAERTVLLPKIQLKHPRNVIGANTVESIRSGCAYGIGGLCDRIVDEIVGATHRVAPTKKPIIIATGGYAKFMSKYCRKFDAIEPNLTLDGIHIALRRSLGSGGGFRR